MPKLLPVGGRGPYAVGIATEHIRTPSSGTSANGTGAADKEAELWPLELMAQVLKDRLLKGSLLPQHYIFSSAGDYDI